MNRSIEMASGYVGRFAPSPTGPLHAGSLVAALASWLDARAHPGGRWLVRIEDVDRPRCRAGAADIILGQLATCGLLPDETPVRQSSRGLLYEQAAIRLVASGWAYPCGCSRAQIAAAARALDGASRPRGGESVYPGTCADGLHGRPARALRLRLTAPSWRTDPGGAPAMPEPLVIGWHDRRLGARCQNVSEEVGDFVLKRADGCWAYQLAVVVDDGEQAVTDVVRGEDLADNTPRQLHLQRLLGLPTPRYLHAPLVLGRDGEKLSKQNGAAPLDLRDPLAALHAAAGVLGIRVDGADLPTWLASAVEAWREVLDRLPGAGIEPPLVLDSFSLDSARTAHAGMMRSQ